ncbi:MAG: hypothetical protein V1815_01165 [Candidatus Woesearchaeota archaeon]
MDIFKSRSSSASTPSCSAYGGCVYWTDSSGQQKQRCNCLNGILYNCYCDGNTPICKKLDKCPTGKCSGNVCEQTRCGDGVCNTGENCPSDCCKSNCKTTGKKCGSDGCGDSCGTCLDSEICNNIGKCVPSKSCINPGQKCQKNSDCCNNICKSGYCSSDSQTCDTCTSLSYTCGKFVNNCGNELTCTPGCSSGQSCVNNKCTTTPYNPPPPSCIGDLAYCSYDYQCCGNSCINGQCINKTKTCTPNWQCNSWTTCAYNKQYRSCIDYNYCGTTTGKPIESQGCYTCVGLACPLAESSASTSTTSQTCTSNNQCPSDYCDNWRFGCSSSNTVVNMRSCYHYKCIDGGCAIAAELQTQDVTDCSITNQICSNGKCVKTCKYIGETCSEYSDCCGTPNTYCDDSTVGKGTYKCIQCPTCTSLNVQCGYVKAQCGTLNCKTCPVGSYCNNVGQCTKQIERCSSGQYKCEKDINGKYTNWMQKCDSNGNWYNAVYCNYGCDLYTGQCIGKAKCIPKTCSQLNSYYSVCGKWDNGCGSTIYCNCPSGSICSDGYRCIKQTCIGDKGYCSTNSQCCGNSCINGQCINQTQTCKSLASKCLKNSECCSQYCYGGYCKNPTVVVNCKDSDNGKNYYVQGRYSQCYSDGSCLIDRYDACTDSYTLREGYCENNLLKEEFNVNCPNGCKDGACIQQSNLGSGAGSSTPTTSQCTVGQKCYSTKYQGYQNADCSWNGLTYCKLGCNPATGRCY